MLFYVIDLEGSKIPAVSHYINRVDAFGGRIEGCLTMYGYVNVQLSKYLSLNGR